VTKLNRAQEFGMRNTHIPSMEKKFLMNLLLIFISLRCTCEIKSRIAMAKAAFNKKKNLFTSKFDLTLRKKLVKC
jgi:hypothetical protein